MKRIIMLTAALLAGLVVLPAMAYKMEKAGMDASRDIVAKASASPDHKTLVTAIQAAGLVETLQGEGPFTVFAPTDAAFAKLPDGTLDTLLEPGNRDQLSAILTYHVLPGRIDSKGLAEAISEAGGTLRVESVQKGSLSFRVNGDNVLVEDAKGQTARIAAVDLFGSNGVIHVIDGVLLPE